MYDVSLFPKKYQLERIKNARKTDILISFLSTAIIIGILCLMSMFVLNARRAEYVRAVDENTRLAGELASLSQYSKIRDTVTKTIADVDTIVGNEPKWSAVLTEITESAPESVKISTMNITYDTTAMTTACDLSGNASDFNDVTLWITTLQGFEDIGEIKCTNTTESEANTSSVVSFNLKIEILNAAAKDNVVWNEE